MKKTDRTNQILAGFVFLGSFIVYAMTVQRSFSFWDCGEFIASSYILGIPHPPGTPLYVLIGRVFSMIGFVEDIAYRVNYFSVISSAVTALFSYLLTVKIVSYFFDSEDSNPVNKLIGYVGGVAAGFFVAFSLTNWGNSVEAEVYGASLALMTSMFYLAIRYRELIDTPKSTRIMVLVFFMAMAGIGIHMTSYLVIPVAAMFFILKKEATARDWALMCGFGLVELLLIILFADGRGGPAAFFLVSAVLSVALFVTLYKKINWAILIAIVCLSTVMVSFSLFFKAAPTGIVAILILAYLSNKKGWGIHWKPALTVLILGVVGLSVHGYIPVRSALNPRIDENNPSRDTYTFVRYLDRKQYGQTSMTDRMFNRRGTWSNQFGRHPHMGYWSYFEEQYGPGGWGFAPFFALGMLGMLVAIRRRLELGLPFFTLFIVCSVGLILYMNFADGTMYNERTQDAYLEVRNRDYFFTPAFVFFGIAMGLGVSAIMTWLKDRFAAGASGSKAIVYASSALVLLPAITLAHNYHACDRSTNNLPYVYAKNILDSCPPNTILFTSGDNDTFPVWCLQEVYEYRKDVRVVNLSLLNTDWYTAQMKNRYDVPISLTDEQILWYPYEHSPGLVAHRPNERFLDRPRRKMAYLQAYVHGGNYVRVQDMMMDEIVIENKWINPIYFTAPPYGTSPLDLRGHATTVGTVMRLDREPEPGLYDVEGSYDMFMNTYTFEGLESAETFRDDNATGVFQAVGARGVMLFEALLREGDTTRAMNIINRLTSEYVEYWQSYLALADYYDRTGDSAKALEVIQGYLDKTDNYLELDPHNQYYMQDIGMAKTELGHRTNQPDLIDEGVKMVSEGFLINPNNIFAFRKAAAVLGREQRGAELFALANVARLYKRNLSDPYLRQILGLGSGASSMPLF